MLYSRSIAGITALLLAMLAQTAAATRYHPVEHYCADYKVSGMEKGTYRTCQVDYGVRKYEKRDTKIGIGPFKQTQKSHVITVVVGEGRQQIYTLQKGKAQVVDNPAGPMLQAMEGKDPEDIGQTFMQAMDYRALNKTKTVNGVLCNQFRSTMAGLLCMTPDWIIVEQDFMGQKTVLQSLSREPLSAEDQERLDPESWGVPIKEGPDIGNIMRQLGGATSQMDEAAQP
ncbi:MAG: hypothetical protein AAF513_17100 [Pseudomonadota bacterium]